MKTPLQTTFRLATLGLLGALSAQPSLAQRPIAVDVSHYQGSINWTSVKNAGYTFAWAKATEGTYGQDDTFVNNENNGKAAGVYIGAYHFPRPDLDSPGVEVSYFWNFAGGYIKADGKTYMPMLDMETFQGLVGASSYAAWANTWCSAIQANASAAGVNITPVIYTTTCEACNLDSSVAQWISDIANPSGESAQTGSPWDFTSCDSCNWWGTWGVWQYDWHGVVSGITGEVDRDVYNGTLSGMVSAMVATSSHPNPSAVVNASGDMELFAIDTDTSVYVTTQTTPAGGWGSWVNLNASAIQQVSAIMTHNNYPEVFVLGGDGAIYSKLQSSSGWPSSWNNLTGDVIAIAPVLKTNGCEQIFALDTIGAVWYREQTTPNGSWGGWTSLGGGGNTVISAIVGYSGATEVFVSGNGKNVNKKSFTGSGWSGWTSLGGGINNLSVIVATNHCEQVFALDTVGAVWFTQQTAPGSSTWTSWSSLGGGNNTRVSALVTPNGATEVFVTGGGSVNHKWWTGTGWTPTWTSQGGTANSLCFVLNQGGREQVFCVFDDHSMEYIEKTSVSGGWASWVSLGTSFE